MKPISRVLVLLVAAVCAFGCRSTKTSPLHGTWLLKRHALDGLNLSSTITIQKTGSYQCETHYFTNSTPLFTTSMEGAFQIQEGYLVDTVTKHSEPTVTVPWVIKAKIVRFEGDELIALDGANCPFTMRRLSK
jgi:hypothetical protein